MSQTNKPIAGQVYERDGKQREVIGVEGDMGWEVLWRRPFGKTVRRCWCSTWLDWVSKATLVEAKSDEPEDV